MKTMKAKIIALIVGLTILLCGILGVMNVVLNTATAEQVLKDSMLETAEVAAVRIQKELEIVKQIAIESGCITELSNANATIDDKNLIVQTIVESNGFLGGNLLGTDGVSLFDGTDFSDRDYFASAIKGQPFISGPLVSKLTGLYSVIIAAPVWKEGRKGTEVTGVVYFKPDVKILSGIVSTIKVGETGGAYIVDKDGLTIAHSDEKVVFTYNAILAAKEDPSQGKIAQITQDMVAGSNGFAVWDEKGARMAQAYAPIEGTDGWSVGVYVDEDEFLGSVQTAILLTVGVSVLFIIVGAVISIIFTKKVLKPVNIASEYMMKIAKGEDIEALDENRFKGEFRPIAESINEVRTSLYMMLNDTSMLADAALDGNLTVRADASKHQGGYRGIIEGVNRTLDAVIAPINEAAAVLGELSKGNLGVTMEGDYKGDYAAIKDALNGTIETLKGYIGEISYTLSKMADGDLAMNIDSDFKGDFIELKNSINSIADSLSRVMSEINIAAEQVSAGTKQVSDGSQAISQGATEQSSAIEQLTATVTEIAEQTKSNAVSAGKANELAVNAKKGAAEGNEQMKAMQNAMEEINESSANISKIIKVIDDIAFQTNILALNAAVEAARAGVHGKGFAVVAEEVRNLAARSANAAKETTALIEGSIKKTEAGTDIANKTAQALSAIVEEVDKAAELTGQIAVASDEQATGITQVNNGIEQLSTVVQTNSATSEETAASSEELSSQAEMLKSMVGRFKLKEEAKEQPAAKPEPKVKEAGAEPAKPCIALNDSEFGKY